MMQITLGDVYDVLIEIRDALIQPRNVLTYYVVAEHVHGEKHSIHLSNSPDYPNQSVEKVLVVR